MTKFKQLIKSDWQNTTSFEQYRKIVNKFCIKQDLWEQKIIGTKLPCYGKTNSVAKQIVPSLKLGNYVSFIKNLKIKTHLDSIICAYLLNTIDDWTLYVKLLKDYANKVDNWASCDSLKFNKHTNKNLLNLSRQLLDSNKEFVRRIGVNIYFQIIKESKDVNKAFMMLDKLSNETSYYVNMSAAWLICELFIKYREQTIAYIKNNKTNGFIINKSISKCRDSYRVSTNDKKILLKFKK